MYIYIYINMNTHREAVLLCNKLPELHKKLENLAPYIYIYIYIYIHTHTHREAVLLCNKLPELHKKLENLAEMHAVKGVTASHVPVMGKVVLTVIRQALGAEDFTPQVCVRVCCVYACV